MDLDACFPMRWACGPLEIVRARRRPSFTPREADVIGAWTSPAALDLLSGTPVNGLVVPWAEGGPRDEEQQRGLVPLVAAARGRGLSIIGWVSEAADPRRAAAAAVAAGLSMVATPSGETLPGQDVLRFRKRGFGSPSSPDFLGDLDAVWPGLRTTSPTAAPDADAVSGPTGAPWLDSNGWYVRLARALSGPRTVWLAFEPPDVGRAHAASSYLQAIADTEAYGARWLVSLDAHVRVGLLEGRASARETWSTVCRALAFFGEHRAWAGYSPVGQLGVVSDYRGPNEFLSFETLNLLGRQGSLYRIVEKGAAVEATLLGLDAILYVDEAPPAADLLRKLYAFSEGGGTLITPPGWPERGVLVEDFGFPRHRVFRYGGGRLAIAREEAVDPQQLAEDAQLLMSHRHDRLRVYNVGAGLRHYVTSADSGTGVLHTLSFPTPSPPTLVTAWFRQPWARGRAWTVDAAQPTPVERAVVPGGVEFHVPAQPLYCALEVTA